MPTFAISPVPVQVSQVVTQAALIQNIGTTNVYLDTDSSVSIASYGVVLGPRDSITWQSDRALWAVTGAGNVSSLSVAYGVDASTLGSVNVIGTVEIDGDVTLSGPVDIAGPVTVEGTVDIGNVVQTEITNTVSTTVTGTVDTLVSGPVTIAGTIPVEGDVNVSGPVTVTNTVAIDGTVDIDLPVKVQGGGELLYSGTVSVPHNPTGVALTIPVNAPSNGLTYYGVRISIEVLTAGKLIGLDVDMGLGVAVASTSIYLPTSPDIGIGRPSRHIFTMPMMSNYPVNLLLWNGNTTGAANVSISVHGVSAALPYPVTDSSIWGSSLYQGNLSWTPGDRIYLPPTFQPLALRNYRGSGSNNPTIQHYIRNQFTLASGTAGNVAGVELQNWDVANKGAIATSAASLLYPNSGGYSSYLVGSGTVAGVSFLSLLANGFTS